MVIDPARPKRTISAEFYRTDAGGEPVRDFLKKVLTPDERKAVGRDIRTVEYGWPIGMPGCREMKNGLHEVRTDLKDRTCRIMFGIYGSRMVLFHGFIKKDRAISKADMGTALERKKALEKRK